MGPEMPYLLAGAITIAGGAVKEKKWPPYTGRAIIGTLTLVVVASTTADSKLAPLVRAIGLLFLLAAIMATVRAVKLSPSTSAGNKLGKAAGQTANRVGVILKGKTT